jgi:hypothetical protein
LNQPLRLTIYFDGNEADQFQSLLGALTITCKPSASSQLKLIASAFNSTEDETYDILGQYWLALLNNAGDPGDLTEVIETKGVGSYLSHARNSLEMKVVNIEHRGLIEKGDNTLQWGIKFQHESIKDRLKEWILIDSAGYSLPNASGIPGQNGNQSGLVLNSGTTAANNLESNRYSAFLQDTWAPLGKQSGFTVSAGARIQYCDVNKQLLLSPRGTIAFRPGRKGNLLFRFSAGFYYQPPFYREMRAPDGILNTAAKAQESVHFVLGNSWDFKSWNRPFKLTTEIYYKKLSNLIPFSYDNVRINYSGQNESKGYAKGIDLKINGEFVPGIDSWFSLSVMDTREDVQDDFYYDYYNKNGLLINRYREVPADSIIRYPGYFARPTDQRVTFGMFFQDYLPSNPTYKMSIGLYFGTGLPTGAPNTSYFTHTFRMPFYRRVDIGFSKQIIGSGAKPLKVPILRSFKSMWLTAEVFNLLQVNNVASYTWVKDFENNQYGVPNYLTPRQLNIKLGIGF